MQFFQGGQDHHCVHRHPTLEDEMPMVQLEPASQHGRVKRSPGGGGPERAFQDLLNVYQVGIDRVARATKFKKPKIWIKQLIR